MSLIEGFLRTKSVKTEVKKMEPAPKPMQQAASSQKYEKTASTKSKSSHFEEDEKKHFLLQLGNEMQM
jgi:hypothetical protein